MTKAIVETSIPGLRKRQGKVRDIYELENHLFLVSTDRISAFDWVLPTGIPHKGQILNQLSAFWFELVAEPHHLVTTDLNQMPLPPGADRSILEGRTSYVRKTQVIPIECVVRGYISGSAWREYCRSGTVCGIPLPKGLLESDALEEPIFTPATKAETGHDENITFEEMIKIVGEETALELRERSLRIFQLAANYARERGIIIADTKFEFGRLDGQIVLIDEIFTPDSSRFWPADAYKPGRSQPSFDKQFVRDWLESVGWDKNSPPPPLPDDIVEKTRTKYIEAYERLTGRRFVCR